MSKMTKHDRVAAVNKFIQAIASCGRKFFVHEGFFARFEIDQRGHVWFIDDYSKKRIYTHYDGRWEGFTHGGTLKGLVESLRDYIRTGIPKRLNIGPWPQWICHGDLWGYGEDIKLVRAAAIELGLIPSESGATRDE